MPGIEYTVRKNTERELELVLEGEDHTLGNILVRNLTGIDGVEEAYYSIEHPLKKNIVVYVRTRGSVTPTKALERALDNALSELRELEKSLEEAMGEK